MKGLCEQMEKKGQGKVVERINSDDRGDRKTVLVVEDDMELRMQLKTRLEYNGYAAKILLHFENACEGILASGADLVLLDIVLPGIDGEMLLRSLRKKSNIPVIMVTSKDTEMDEVICMSLGADDYITKPYNPSILLLHMEAVFKRMGRYVENKIVYGELTVDAARGTICVHGEDTELSKNEMRILVYLLNHRGRVVSRNELMNYLWDNEEFVDDNTLTVNINRVRRKLKENGLTEVIHTRRGLGYIIG